MKDNSCWLNRTSCLQYELIFWLSVTSYGQLRMMTHVANIARQRIYNLM